MYVQEIHIKSFRHLENVHLGPFPAPPQASDLIALAGPNGGGKSSILELLGYALSNSWNLTWHMQRSFTNPSFEIALGITSDELNLIREYLTVNSYPNSADIVEYLEHHHRYYRSYDYTDKSSPYDQNMQNQIHKMITQVLRNYNSRQMGLFLRSDRSYPQGAFSRDRLFHYHETIQRDYIRNMAFSNSDVQYRDMFEFLVQQRYHSDRQLGTHTRMKSQGKDVGDPPGDPIQPYDNLLQSLLPGYSFAETNEDLPSNLMILIPSGDVVNFNDLSSGEKEVFFILSSFLRHNVSRAIIMVDEPEMHLHPELSRRLVRLMQSIRNGNQVWVATHNPEVIDEAGRDRVFYISLDSATRKASIVAGTSEPEAILNMRDLFGYSGYVGIAKSIVFLEGSDSSSDRKILSSLLTDDAKNIKLIPSRSSDNMSRINSAILSILQSQLSWISFYMVRDRDYLTDNLATVFREKSGGRLYILKRHEIENYLIDEEIIASVQEEVFGKVTTADEIRSKLRIIARELSGEVLRNMISFRLNLIYRPEDFSLANFMHGEKFIDNNGNWLTDKVEQLSNSIARRVTEVNNDLADRTNIDTLQALIVQYQEEISRAVTGTGDQWRTLFPGKRLLEEYAKREGLGRPPILQNSIIKELRSQPGRIADELKVAFKTIAEGRLFSS